MSQWKKFSRPPAPAPRRAVGDWARTPLSLARGVRRVWEAGAAAEAPRVGARTYSADAALIAVELLLAHVVVKEVALPAKVLAEHQPARDALAVRRLLRPAAGALDLRHEVAVHLVPHT